MVPSVLDLYRPLRPFLFLLFLLLLLLRLLIPLRLLFVLIDQACQASSHVVKRRV